MSATSSLSTSNSVQLPSTWSTIPTANVNLISSLASNVASNIQPLYDPTISSNVPSNQVPSQIVVLQTNDLTKPTKPGFFSNLLKTSPIPAPSASPPSPVNIVPDLLSAETKSPNQANTMDTTGNLENNENNNKSKSTRSSILITVIGVVIFILAGVPAALLSWKCNSSLGYSKFKKVIYAIGAFVTGLYYIFYYLFYRADICKHCALMHSPKKPPTVRTVRTVPKTI